MIARLETVLDENDFAKILRRFRQFSNFKLTDVCEHLSVAFYQDHIALVAGHTLKNELVPFMQRLKTEQAGNKALTSRQRKAVLEDAYRSRDVEIAENKWYLSEEHGRDVGLLFACAHWLLTRGPEFYRLFETSFDKKGVFFRFVGNEKSILLDCNDASGLKAYCNITTKSFVTQEQILSQRPLVQQLTEQKCDAQTYRANCEKARALLDDLENRFYVILNDKQ